MAEMLQPARLIYADGTVEFVLVEDRAPDGSRVLRPDTSLDAIRVRLGTDPVGAAPLEAFLTRLQPDPGP